MDLLKELLEMEAKAGEYIEYYDWFAKRKDFKDKVVFPGDGEVIKHANGSYTVILGNQEPEFETVRDAAIYLYVNFMVPERFDKIVVRTSDKEDAVFKLDGDMEAFSKKYNVDLISSMDGLHIVGTKDDVDTAYEVLEKGEAFSESYDAPSDKYGDFSDEYVEDDVMLDLTDDEIDSLENQYEITFIKQPADTNGPAMDTYQIKGTEENVKAFLAKEYS